MGIYDGQKGIHLPTILHYGKSVSVASRNASAVGPPIAVQQRNVLVDFATPERHTRPSQLQRWGRRRPLNSGQGEQEH
jgi:hypothetical protein